MAGVRRQGRGWLLAWGVCLWAGCVAGLQLQPGLGQTCRCCIAHVLCSCILHRGLGRRRGWCSSAEGQQRVYLVAPTVTCIGGPALRAPQAAGVVQRAGSLRTGGCALSLYRQGRAGLGFVGLLWGSQCGSAHVLFVPGSLAAAHVCGLGLGLAWLCAWFSACFSSAFHSFRPRLRFDATCTAQGPCTFEMGLQAVSGTFVAAQQAWLGHGLDVCYVGALLVQHWRLICASVGCSAAPMQALPQGKSTAVWPVLLLVAEPVLFWCLVWLQFDPRLVCCAQQAASRGVRRQTDLPGLVCGRPQELGVVPARSQGSCAVCM